MENKKKIHNRIAALSLDAALLVAVLLLAETVLFPTSADAASRANGFLAKNNTSPTVYFVSENNYKLAIPSAKVFLSYGYKWPQVKSLSQAELDAYPQAKYISENSSAAIYFLDKSMKRYVTQASASALEIKSEEVVSVNRTEFRSYATGARLETAEASQIALAQNSNPNIQNPSAPAEEKCVPDPAVGGEDGCKIYEAAVKNNPDLCSGIKDANYLPSCYATFDSPAGQPATFYCEKISDLNLKQVCVGKVAIRKKDLYLCNSINTKSILNECLAGVGIVSGDLSKCSLLPIMTATNQNTLNQDTCVYMYAILNSDTAACEKMPKGSAYYDGCIKFSKPAVLTQ